MCRLALILLALLYLACSAEVGDECSTDLECGTGLICDQYSYDGYCTLEDCEYSGCPDGAHCITFEDETTYCMAACSSNNECRDGYACVIQEDSASYCGQQ